MDDRELQIRAGVYGLFTLATECRMPIEDPNFYVALVEFAEACRRVSGAEVYTPVLVPQEWPSDVEVATAKAEGERQAQERFAAILTPVVAEVEDIIQESLLRSHSTPIVH